MAMLDSSSSSGSAGSQISLRVTKRDDSKSDVSTSCGPFPHQPIVTVSFSSSHVGFSKKWSVVSTKFLVDDDVVVVATESDAVASWIVWEEPFALMDNKSLFIEFDEQVPRERTVDLPKQRTCWEEIWAQLSMRRRHPQ